MTVQKHPPDAYTPPGLEWWILRRLPKVSLAVTLAFGLGWWLIRIWPRHGSDTEIASQTLLAEYALLGGFVFFITMVILVIQFDIIDIHYFSLFFNISIHNHYLLFLFVRT